MKRRATASEIEQEIAELPGRTITELQVRWRELYATVPPFKVRSGFLRYAIAYRLQEHLHGGLSTSTKRLLRAVAKQGRERRKAPQGVLHHLATPPEVQMPVTGTQLIREWNGKLETVEVTEQGFNWAGQCHSTLSAVAFAITGTKWSGPRFFGLKAPKRMADAAGGSSGVELEEQA